MPDYYTRAAKAALNHLTNLLGLNRTEVVNRAVRLMDAVETEKANGGEVYVKRGDEFVPLEWDK